MKDTQATLDRLAAQFDPRTSVFDITVERVEDSTLAVRGRVLEESQLEMLTRQFSDWKLDASSVQILHRENMPRRHVATNLTGLYEKPTFGMPLSSELYYGTALEILDEHEAWVFTRQRDGYLGWAFNGYLAEGSPEKATHLVLAPSYELRAQADPVSNVVTRLVSGTGVRVEEVQDNWARVVANKIGWLPVSLLRPLSDVPASLEEKRKALAADSARMIGIPYLWGGMSGNGIDCSGFMRLLHRWIGIDIPRDADMQHAAAQPVEPPFETGDVLFFAESGNERKITHVGMSLSGWMMIHASRKHNGVYVEDVREDPWRKQAFVSAGSFLR
ncbi:MAG TPA: NlpC/P60 family protein [Anaerolineales bacterium]|nr:NlpC/P60 family protein [Anaerolineales bacterium]